MSSIFLTVADMSIMASIVILVVLLVRLLLKRAPKIFSYILWSVVLLRLLCPFTLETDLSIIPKEAQGVPQEHTIVDFEQIPVPYEQIPVSSVLTAGMQAIGDALNGGLGLIRIVYDSEEYGSRETTYAVHDQVWLLFLRYLWPVGIAVMFVYSLVSYIKLRRRLIGAMPLRDNIYLADYITSPFVMGLIHPKIYLPSSLSEQEQEYIILHEKHHIWRFDHVVKALSFIALCVHWFNPLVWAAFVLSGKDMEMSCDEAVVKKLGTEIRADYSASLLSLATGRRIIAGTPLAFGEGDTKGRIKNLAKWKKPAIWISTVAVIIVALVIVICGTNGRTDESWFKVEQLGNGFELNFNLKEPVNSWAIYEDIYEEGQLISSVPRISDSFIENGGAAERRSSILLSVQLDWADRTVEGVRCAYVSAGIATWEVELPKTYYTGAGMTVGDSVVASSHRKRDLPESGESVLYSVILSTEPSGRTTAYDRDDGIIGSNDTVIQFRLVTSTEGMDQFTSQKIPDHSETEQNQLDRGDV